MVFHRIHIAHKSEFYHLKSPYCKYKWYFISGNSCKERTIKLFVTTLQKKIAPKSNNTEKDYPRKELSPKGTIPERNYPRKELFPKGTVPEKNSHQ